MVISGRSQYGQVFNIRLVYETLTITRHLGSYELFPTHPALSRLKVPLAGTFSTIAGSDA
jgi:hypothetical protein